MPKGKGYGTKPNKPKKSTLARMLGTGMANKAAKKIISNQSRSQAARAAAQRAMGIKRNNQTTDSNN